MPDPTELKPGETPPETPPAETPPPAEAPVVTARQRALAEIESAREPQLTADAAEDLDIVDEEGNIVPKEEETPPTETPPEETPPVETPPAEAKPDLLTALKIDPEAEVEIIVDGKPIKVKAGKILDQGVRTLQKETAADLRLDLANRLLEEIQNRGKPPAETPPKEEPPKELDYKALVKSIQLGTEEQATEALKVLVESTKAPPMTIEQVMDALNGPLSVKLRDELDFRRGTEFVQSEYGDLMKDPYLRRLFFSEERRMRAPKEQGGMADTRPYAELYRELGDNLRKHFNRPKPGTPPTNSAAERKEAKLKAQPVPKTAASRLAGGEPVKAPTVLDTIDEIRKARHQRPLIQ